MSANARHDPDVRLTPISIPDLRALAAGRVISLDDRDYESSRQVFNAAIDRHPALVLRAANAVDVSLGVSFARASGIGLAVRGGGHSFAGHGVRDGGLVLDLSDMRALHIDPQRRIAWAQAGLTAGEYTNETARHGLTTGFGDTGSVGIAGITLGGGIGWLVRKHGLTIDDLLAVELVTADGELLHVDEQRHGDLFWALRGGGGNFGVVTRLQYRLHERARASLVATEGSRRTRCLPTATGVRLLPVSREAWSALTDCCHETAQLNPEGRCSRRR